MLRRLCVRAPNAAETALIELLLPTHRQLAVDNGRPDVRSEAGYNACVAFLASLETVARGLGLEAAPRLYRNNFSANYRALFPDDGRHYRVDILEASVDQHSAIWVNGDKFELSAEAMIQAEGLQKAWDDLSELLDRWFQAVGEPGSLCRPARTELAVVLDSFDRAWAGFENKYVSDLIHIEEQARGFIVQAVDHECRLQLLETLHERAEVISEAQLSLIRSIQRLNSVANFHRKGRDDLGADILDSAMVVLQRCAHNASSSGAGTRSAAQILSGDVVSSFTAMRGYLRGVGACLERVDPHLCNNAGLVARLVDWEESWEVGARYVREASMLDAVCDLVTEIRKVQTFVPALTAMCSDFDVELFLVLPRIVLLCFVAGPERERAELVRSLLPHRFVGPPQAAALKCPPSKPCPELVCLIEQYRLTSRALASGATAGAAPGWEILVKRAVAGTWEQGGTRRYDASNLQSEPEKAVEILMKELERWSLELQRHCPEDWNQCSAVLVQCLLGGKPTKPTTAKFLI